jgi:predicted acetyltransferase
MGTKSSSAFSNQNFDSNERKKARELLKEFNENKSEIVNEYFQNNKNLSVLKLDTELLKTKKYWSKIEREAKINYLIQKGNFDKETATAYVNGLEDSYVLSDKIYAIGGKNNNTKKYKIKKNKKKNKNKKTKRVYNK